MQRFNLFYPLHKGLRAALYDTAHTLQQTDFTVPAASENAFEKIGEALLLFDEQNRKEDRFILRMLTAFEPSVAATFGDEHLEIGLLARALQEKLEAFAALDTAFEKARAGQALSDAFTEFLVFALRHLTREEKLLNTCLWRYYTDAELKRTAASILDDTAPWIRAFFCKWILRGLNAPEAAAWLQEPDQQSFRQAMPAASAFPIAN